MFVKTLCCVYGLRGLFLIKVIRIQCFSLAVTKEQCKNNWIYIFELQSVLQKVDRIRGLGSWIHD